MADNFVSFSPENVAIMRRCRELLDVYLQNRRRGIGCSRVKKCGKHDKKYKEEFNHEDHDV